MPEQEIESLIEEIKSLREMTTKLYARVDHLEKRHERAVKIACDCDELLIRYCKELRAENSDAFGRIKNLELKFFPHLASDIEELHKLIGNVDDQPECSHERRKP